VRDAGRGERARAVVAEHADGGAVAVHLADLSRPAEVRAFAERFAAEQDALHVLVNNAGVLLSERTETPDGIETVFATNVLGPFLLTNLLLGLLERSAPSRVVNVSSGGMYTARLDVSDLQTERRAYDGPDVYARTKRAEVVLTELWAERLAGTGVTVHAMHPGWADTPGVSGSLPRFHAVTGPLLRTPDEGADTIVWLGAAAEPALRSGRFWHDRRERATHRVPRTCETAADRAALWAACARLTGWTDPAGPPGGP